MTNDDGRKPEGAPERSPKAGAGRRREWPQALFCSAQVGNCRPAGARQHPSLAAAHLAAQQQLRPIPGIYQVRGFDLSDITFVCGKTGWIVFDPLVSAEPVRAAWALFQ